MSLTTSDLEAFLAVVEQYGTTISELILSLLRNENLTQHVAVRDLLHNVDELLGALHQHPQLGGQMSQWARHHTEQTCAKEIVALTRKENGLQFNVSNAKHDQLEKFDISDVADKMRGVAPVLWAMLEILLSADSSLVQLRHSIREKRRRENQDTEDIEMGSPRQQGTDGCSEDEYWNMDDENGECWEDLEPGEEDNTEKEETKVKVLTMKKVVCMSIMMQSTNQTCNALQSMVGIFLHSCNAPEAVVEFLSRTGVSISRTSIDDAITNLSKEASEEIKQLGQTLLASYAYDNFDVEIKESIPTVEKPHDNLLHLISGTIFPLDHGVTREDLACAAELWEKSPDNPRNHKMPRGVNWKKLVALHPETLTNPSDLTRRQRFNAWKFVDDLVSHGPEYFHQFKGDLGMPEVIDAIPITKSKQVPVEGMDINQSTVQGNADALTNLFKQGGIGDPNEQPGVVDVGDHVIIVHGDLSTCERVQSVQMSRAEERTPWRRFQNVKFGNGLFHLKMACADAIWKVFIYPKNSREDDTSLMRMIAEIRPKETIKIGSKPGFR